MNQKLSLPVTLHTVIFRDRHATWVDIFQSEEDAIEAICDFLEENAWDENYTCTGEETIESLDQIFLEAKVVSDQHMFWYDTKLITIR